jgi:hypothetical protein
MLQDLGVKQSIIHRIILYALLIVKHTIGSRLIMKKKIQIVIIVVLVILLLLLYLIPQPMQKEHFDVSTDSPYSVVPINLPQPIARKSYPVSIPTNQIGPGQIILYNGPGLTDGSPMEGGDTDELFKSLGITNEGRSGKQLMFSISNYQIMIEFNKYTVGDRQWQGTASFCQSAVCNADADGGFSYYTVYIPIGGENPILYGKEAHNIIFYDGTTNHAADTKTIYAIYGLYQHISISIYDLPADFVPQFPTTTGCVLRNVPDIETPCKTQLYPSTVKTCRDVVRNKQTGQIEPSTEVIQKTVEKTIETYPIFGDEPCPAKRTVDCDLPLCPAPPAPSPTPSPSPSPGPGPRLSPSPSPSPSPGPGPGPRLSPSPSPSPGPGPGPGPGPIQSPSPSPAINQGSTYIGNKSAVLDLLPY